MTYGKTKTTEKHTETTAIYFSDGEVQAILSDYVYSWYGFVVPTSSVDMDVRDDMFHGARATVTCEVKKGNEND